MLRLIYRQRRRLLFGSVFSAIGIMLMALDMGAWSLIDAGPFWFGGLVLALTTLIVALGVFGLGVLIVLFMPNWRMLIEVFGLVILITAALDILAPGLSDIPYLGAFLPFVITVAVFSVMYGEVLDRFRLWVDYRAERSFVSPKSPDALWAELVPGAAPLAAHWDSLLYSLEADPEDPDSYAAQYTHGSSVYEHQTMTFLDRDQPHHARYHHVGEVDPGNRSLVEGIFEVRIAPRSRGGSTVTLSTRRDLMLHRLALAMWFDDHLGDQADHLRARHHGRRDWSHTGRYRRKVGQFA